MTQIEGSQSKELNLISTRNAKSCSIQYGSGIESSESETDLAAMVHEFIETGSHGFDQLDGSDSDRGSSSPAKLRDNLQAFTSSKSPLEKSLLTVLKKIIPVIYEQIDLVCLEQKTECKAGCVRRLIVKYLRSMGSDASICKLKWQSPGKVLGGDSYAGEYEYLDVMLDKGCVNEKRLIIDLDFQSQFEIARPTQHYLETLKLLPAVFIGSVENLDQILQVMSDAARCSLKQNSMHLPPWRTLDYMRAKWLSPCERITDALPPLVKKGIDSSDGHSLCNCSESNQCLELLRRIKASLLGGSEKVCSTSVSFEHKRSIDSWRKKKIINDSRYSS
ncbi:hypothetical protein O6H91_14G007700 [Diphasiastrum complanatum]|nr:hypothetical protein O6H91_14G007700 [Diphasiastrum complanatum]